MKRIARIGAYLGVFAGLVVNAVIHFRLASTFDAVVGTLVTQGDLFRIQSIACIVAAIAVVAFRRWWVTALAGALALGGLVLVVASTAVLIDGTVVGLPVLFEPVWYPDKVAAAVAQGVALMAAFALSATHTRRPESS